eukprot:2311973-Pleurochrysis_carterae.AAC.2
MAAWRGVRLRSAKAQRSAAACASSHAPMAAMAVCAGRRHEQRKRSTACSCAAVNSTCEVTHDGDVIRGWSAVLSLHVQLQAFT